MEIRLPDFARLSRRAPAMPPVFPGLAQVRAYWEGLRSGGEVPDRSRLDPRGLAGVLDRIFLAEGIGRGLVQVRIAGSALGALAGMDLRGLPLSCVFAAPARPVLAATLEGVLGGRSLAELDVVPERGAHQAATARLLLLPLRQAGGHPLVLGAFGLAGDAALQGPLRVLSRREEALVLPAREVPDDSAPLPAPILRRGHLALVHSVPAEEA